jgi:Domain of unknown function (DUF4177)
MEYKVLTERDSRFSGSFDPESLETTLNSYASEGWRVISGHGEQRLEEHKEPDHDRP